MTKRKKGQAILYGLLAGLLAAIIVSTVSSIVNKRDFAAIGSSSMIMLGSSLEAEKALLYIDQSAKYSLQQSIYELAQNGVSVSEFDINEINIDQPFIKNKCGKFKDAYVWYELKKDASGNYAKNQCFDSDKDFLIINLVYIFNKNLNQYLTNSPYNIPIRNYNYKVKDNIEVIGEIRLTLPFDILKDEAKPVIKKPIETQIEQKKSEEFTQSTEENLCAKGVKCVLTDEAYKLLLEAQKIAVKKGKKLIVNSAYRSQKEQEALWNKFAATYPNFEDRRKRVCDPTNDKCPHTTGNAVDVVLKGKTTKTMTNYDWLTLHEIMTEAGWVRYGAENRFDLGEPWHFECCGTNRYARAQAKGVTAIV